MSKQTAIPLYFKPMPRSPLAITKTVKLCFDASSYWIFQSIDVPDPNFPDTWKAISRFCRWWIADHGFNGDLRDVYGILQLTKPQSARALKSMVAFPDDVDMIPATLKVQTSYLPPTVDYEEFVLREYGEQKHCFNATDHLTPKSVKYAKLAIKLGMDPHEAQDKMKVIEFFRSRRKDKKKKSKEPWKPLTQSLGDIPNLNYDPLSDHDLGNCHLMTSDSDSDSDNKLIV